MGDEEELEFYFGVNVEGEEACSGSLIITKEVKHCQMIEVRDIHFHLDSAVVLPGALENLACCYIYAMEYPDKSMLVTGHADRTSTPEYNQWLSKMRAENVLDILLGRRKKWVDSVTTPKGALRLTPKGRSRVKDYLMILVWVANKYGWSCNPEPVPAIGSVKWGRYARRPRNKKAVKVFQEMYNKEFNKSIEEKGLMGPETWGAFFDLYMLEFAELLGHDSDVSQLETYRNGLRFVNSYKKVGGGEDHAITRLHESEVDRRVEILFFDPGEEPELKFHPDCHEGPPGDPEKAKKCELFGKPGIYGKSRLKCDLDHILFVKVQDHEDNPLGGVKVVIEREIKGKGSKVETKLYGTGETNANGVFVVRDVPEGAYVVSVDKKEYERRGGFTGIKKRVEMPK